VREREGPRRSGEQGGARETRQAGESAESGTLRGRPRRSKSPSGALQSATSARPVKRVARSPQSSRRSRTRSQRCAHRRSPMSSWRMNWRVGILRTRRRRPWRCRNRVVRLCFNVSNVSLGTRTSVRRARGATSTDSLALRPSTAS